jgi:hypothetical protein
MQALEDDYNLLIDRIVEVNKVCMKMEIVLEEVKNTLPKDGNNELVDYVQSSFSELTIKLKELTDINSDNEKAILFNFSVRSYQLMVKMGGRSLNSQK